MTKRKPKFPGLGSVSTGTLRTADLIVAFEDALRSAGVKPSRPAGIGRFLEERPPRRGDADPDLYLHEDLYPALEELAAPYTYFGANEGDGADIGYWPSWDSIEEDRRTGELPSGDELPGLMDGMESGDLFLVVNDHGNAELFQRLHGARWVSLWSVV